MNRQRWLDLACLLVGGALLAAYVRVPPLDNAWDEFPATIFFRAAYISQMAEGSGHPGDVLQDMVGFRRLIENRNPYPVLEDGVKDLGLQMKWNHASTHPPTAFLLAGPIAYLPLSSAVQVWLALGFALLFLSLICYGVRWTHAFALALALGVLWGPVASSFRQITFFWLAGVAVAYRFRDRRPLWAGVALGVAALTKLLPVGIVGYFLFARKFRAALGLAILWTCAVAVVLLMEPSAFNWYLGAGSQHNTAAQIVRADNLSPFAQAYFRFGHWGLLVVVAYVAVLLGQNRAALFTPQLTRDYSFFLYSFLAMLLLPLCWGFSMLPLLPVLGYFAFIGKIVHKSIALACLILLGLLPPFGIFPAAFAPLASSSVLLLASTMFLLPVPFSRGLGPRD